MTSNIQEFIGRIGLNGLFVGAMTSCSLAIQKDVEKILPMLNIVYRDELSTDNRE